MIMLLRQMGSQAVVFLRRLPGDSGLVGLVGLNWVPKP